MSKKLYFLISFVLVLSLAPVSFGISRFDFDDAQDANAGGSSTEPGFASFTLDDTGSEVNGIIVDFIDPDGYLEARRRPDPNSDIPSQTPLGVNTEQVHRDFIFAPAQTSITFQIWGLGANQTAEIHIWAFDDSSENTPRRANWYGNGDYLFTTEFMGGNISTWPTPLNYTYPNYVFNATAVANELGSIKFTSDFNESPRGDGYFNYIEPTESEPYAYLNALEVYPIGVPNAVLPAHRPVPFDESEGFPIDETLSWLPGDAATSHDVYLSTDFNDVNEMNGAALVSTGGTDPNYTPGQVLKLYTVYYWRVVEQPGDIESEVWTFVTSNNIVVDNYEVYYQSTAIRNVWTDYWHQPYPGTASQVFLASRLADPPQPSIDDYSMEYRFENGTYGTYSEATIDITQSEVQLENDFEYMNVASISIWFIGLATNPVTETMYAILSDGTGEIAYVDYDGDMNDIKETEDWTEWNVSIDQFLADNCDVDPTNIKNIGIGFAQGAPADGKVYFDDIRLYATRCVQVKRSPGLARSDFAPVQIGGDCEVDYQEVRVIARDWLSEDFVTDTCEILLTDPNLLLYLPFDDFNDANGQGGFTLPQPIKDFIFYNGGRNPHSESNDLNGVIVTKNWAPSPHPNATYAILSPLDPQDDREGITTVESPGVGSIITTADSNRFLYNDGSCIHMENDGPDPGERVSAGRFECVGNFDPGTATHGDDNDAFKGEGDLSVAIWAKWAGPHTGRQKCQGLISKRIGWDDDGLIWMFELDTTPGPRGSFSMRQYNGDFSLYSAGGLMDQYIGQWIHLAAVAHSRRVPDVNECTLYLNGAPTQTGPFYFGGGDPFGITLTVGQDSDIDEQGTENFLGELDEAYLFNRALTSQEIAFLADTTPDDGQISVPVPSAGNIIDLEPQGQRYLNFADFAVMANQWLNKEYWP